MVVYSKGQVVSGGITELARSQMMQNLINHGKEFGFYSEYKGRVQQGLKQEETAFTISFKSSV